MADNVVQEEKNTRFLNSRAITITLFFMAVILALFFIIPNFYEEQKPTRKTDDDKISRNPSESVGLDQFIMNLQKDRASLLPLPPAMIEKSADQPPSAPKTQIVRVYQKPQPAPVAIKVPEQELVAIGKQLRTNKVIALQTSSKVEGFEQEAQGDRDARSQSSGGIQRMEDSGIDINAINSLLAGSNRGGSGGGGLQGLLGAGGQGDQNNQQGKFDFLYSQGKGITPQEYSTNFPMPQQFPLEIKAGTMIPGIMISGLNSDLPGQVMGQVSEHVYDTATGGNVLIPKGSRILGVYDSNISYAQKRVVVVWNRIIAPDGTSLNIAGSQGMDRAGYAGMSGRVDEHWGRVFGTALVASAFVAGADIASNGNTTTTVTNGVTSETTKRTPGQILTESAAQTAIDVGSRLVEKASNIQPTIKIRPGTRFNIFIAQDIIFPEAWAHKTKK